MRRSPFDWRQLTKLLAVAGIYFLSSASSPSVSGGATLRSSGSVVADSTQFQCHVCPEYGFCPWDLPSYDDECQAQCGPWTYAGFCWDNPQWNPYNCQGAAIICYEPD